MAVPSALVLDFDGLILDTETPLVDAWAAVHAEHGSIFDRARGEGIIGHVGIAFDPWDGLPVALDRAGLETSFQRHKNAIVHRQAVLPGVVALLDHATAAGIALGVASNSPHVHVDRHLQRLGLFARFGAVVCREDVAAGKPAPDVYLEACRQLGVAPATAVAFEDSVPGHRAAHAAGLKVVVVPNPCTRLHAFPHASMQLAALDALAPVDLLARLTGLAAAP